MWKKAILGSLIVIITLYGLFQIGYIATSMPSFCAECHQPRGELGKFHAKARGLNYVFQHFGGDYTVPTRAVISDQNCLICHLGDNKNFPNTVRLKNTDKVNHYESIKQSQSCLSCHRDTGHAVDIYLTPDLESSK